MRYTARKVTVATDTTPHPEKQDADAATPAAATPIPSPTPAPTPTPTAGVKPPAAGEPKAARPSLVRRLFKLVGVLAVVGVLLVAGLLVVVQLVLWSDLPRRVVVSQVQQQLGLNVQLDGLSVGWFGETRLKGLTVTLPLKNQPVLEAPLIVAEHNSLPMLVLTRGLRLDSLVIDKPTVYLRQDPQGDWNLQQLAEGLQDRLGGADGGGGGGAVPDLPAVRITDATVTVDRLGVDGTAVFAGASVTAGPAGPGAFTAAATAPGLGEATLQLLPGGAWQHHVDFEAKPGEEALRVAGLEGTIEPGSVQVNGTLRGRVPQGSEVLYRGELELQAATSPYGSASGNVSIKVTQATPPAATTQLAASSAATPRGRGGDPAAAGPVVTLVPDGLTVRGVEALDPLLGADPAADAGDVSVSGGSIVYATGTGDVRADLYAEGFSGRARVEAGGNLNTQTGNARITWDDWTLPVLEGWDLKHGGTWVAVADRTRLGERRVTTVLTSQGQTANGDWDAIFKLDAVGADWPQLTGPLRVERLQVVRQGKRYRLPPLAVDLAVRGDAVAAENLRLTEPVQNASIGGYAVFNTKAQTWMAQFTGNELELPADVSGAPIDLVTLQLAGDLKGAEIQKAKVRVKAAVIEATGRYAIGGGVVEGGDPEPPLLLDVVVKELPVNVFAGGEPLLTAANLEGGLKVAGSLSPLEAKARGTLTARDLRVKGNALGDLDLIISAVADQEVASFETQEFEALGGRWNFNGAYQLQGEPRDLFRVTLAGTDIQLAQLSEFAGEAGALSGVLGFSFMATGPNMDIADARGRGNFRLSRFVHEPVVVDEIFGNLRLDDGVFLATEIQGQRLGGRLREAGVAVPLATLLGQQAGDPVLRVRGRLSDWPIEPVKPEMATATLDAKADVGVRLDALGEGRIDASGGVTATATVYGPREPLEAAATEPTPAAIDDPYARGTLPPGAADPANPPAAAYPPLGEPIAVAQVGLSLNGSIISLDRLDTLLAGGSATGTASVDLADPLLKSRANLTFHDVPADLVAVWLPDIDQAHGRLGGTLRYAPAWDPRPRGDMQLELLLTSDDAGFGQVNLETRTQQLRGDPEPRDYAARVDLFVTQDRPTQKSDHHIPLHRVVIERATLFMADGEVGLFGRISERINSQDGSLERWFYFNPRVQGLSLEPLYATLTDFVERYGVDMDAQLADATAEKEPGKRGTIVGSLDADLRVSGKLPDIMLAPGPFLDQVRQKSFGRGNMQITRSNLGEIPLFSGLFKLLSFSQGGPSATVDSAFRVESGIFVFERFQYQAPGIELRLFARVQNVFLGLQSPIEGYAIASAKPLPDIEGVSALNDAFAAFLGDLTTFRLDGTLEEPGIKPAAAEGIFNSIGSMVAPKRGSAEERDAARERQRALE